MLGDFYSRNQFEAIHLISIALAGYCLLQILSILQKSIIAYTFQIVSNLSSAGFASVSSQENKIPTGMKLFVQMTHT